MGLSSDRMGSSITDLDCAGAFDKFNLFCMGSSSGSPVIKLGSTCASIASLSRFLKRSDGKLNLNCGKRNDNDGNFLKKNCRRCKISAPMTSIIFNHDAPVSNVTPINKMGIKIIVAPARLNHCKIQLPMATPMMPPDS